MRDAARTGMYPTRCRILDVTGQSIPGTGIPMATPPVSRPHVGKEGLATLTSDGQVRITLDDGTVLWGWETWWEAIGDSPQEAAQP